MQTTIDGKASADAATASDVYAFPATPQEQQLWFLDSLYLGNPAYNIPLAYEIAGPLNLSAFDQSLRWVANRHENLRTTFAMRGDEFLQLVEPELEIEFHRIDLTAVPASEQTARRNRIVLEEARHLFNLEKGPLIRGTLLLLGPERHVVVFNFHHIILDHLSVLQFSREFCAAYAAFAGGKAPDLEPPSLQYPDFAVWQEERFAEESFKTDLREWVDRLAGAPVETTLPFDRARGAAQTFAGREVSFSFSPALSTRVREFARSSRKSVFVTMLTAFKCLLARYSGQNDIVVGSPFSNRTISELEGVLGCCMNTLPLRTQLDGTGAFESALTAVHQTVLAAHQRQRVPLKLIVDNAKLDRDASRNPLFQSTFIVQDPPMAIALEGVSVTPLNIHNHTSKFDMAIWMWDAGDRLAGVWEYNTDLFEPATIDRMIANFETFVGNLIAAPRAPWRSVGLLSPAEHALVIDTLNRTNADIPAGTVVDLVRVAAERTPDAVAVVLDRGSLTYRDLWRRSDLLAHRLTSLGVEPGALVGLYIERSLDMVAAMLAVLKTGAAYIPLDPAFPADRIKFMIEDSGLRVLVTQSSLDGHAPDHKAAVLRVDEKTPATAEGAFVARAEARKLAYVRYTSGSTGKPKGVEIGHRALVNFLLSMQREPGFAGTDVLLAVTTLSFDISELEIWLPLISGGKVVLAGRNQVADGVELMRLMREHRVTVMQATPATWRLLLDAGWQGERTLKVLCGGEALPAELAGRLTPKCHELWNMYGPTETTVWSSVRLIKPGEAVRVGGPIANTQFYVVDHAFQAVPLGVNGELLIGGDGLADGYLGRTELTRERFIDNTISHRGKLYRTGDLVRQRFDGTLDFVGRIDNQIKLRGYRIELGEIETALAQNPDIDQAVVLVRDEQLVAYYVTKPDRTVEPSVCREALRARLPEYMVPSAYLRLHAWPLTPNGKIDRKALPSPDSSASTASPKDFVAPRTTAEKQLAVIWSQVLKRTPISIHDNFFDIGGHSLLAVNLFGRVEATFGKRLPLASLFQHPTIGQLATLLEVGPAEPQTWQSLVPIRAEGDRPALFIVHGAGGNILIYRSLANYLAPGIPVHGLQSLGLDGVTKPLTTIEEMAASYAAEIVQKQPNGPYHIGGYCMGGKVAFEIARLLAGQGREVGLVALLDSYNFESAVRVSKFSLYRQMIGFHLRNIFELKPTEAFGYILEKLRMLVEFAAAKSRATGSRMLRRLSGKKNAAPIENFIQTLNDRAGEIYSPKPYAGRVTLFKPQRHYSAFSDPHMGWRTVTQGELEMVRLELNPHAMLVEPYVRKLADAINARLSETKA